jgi:DNA-binding beta-propeller fold protein YncE
LSYSTGASLAVVALIDGDFLAALPHDDPASDFSRFAPSSIAFRPDQMLLIADAGSERVYGLPLDPGQSRTVYTAEFAVRDPQALRADVVGNIYAADGGQRVVEVADTRFRLVGEIVPPYDALGLVQGTVSGIAFGPLGELYLSDPTNGRIYRYDAAGRYISSFTGGEDAGWGQLLQPEGLATANGGTELYVCDAGKRQIAVFDPTGMPLRLFGGTDLEEPWAIAVGTNGQCYVADRKGKTICVFSEQGRLIEKLDGPPIGDARWLGPTDVVIRDSALVVADPPSGRVVIMKVVPSP